MYYKNKMKKVLHDWAYDTKNTNERTLEVINQILEYVTGITELWNKDKGYLESNKDIIKFMNNFYEYPNIYNFLEYYESNEFVGFLTDLMKKGKNNNDAYIIAVKHFSEICEIILKDNNDLVKLCNLLIELDKLKNIKFMIQKEIIIEHFSEIFYKCLIINVIRSKNGVYSHSIGNYENIEKILGIDGILLKEGRMPSIKYVINLEDFETTLINKKMSIEFEQNSFKK